MGPIAVNDPTFPESWEDDEAFLAELRSALDVGPRGDEVPGHRLLEPLGVGGQARVFLAERLADGERVAVKVLELRMLPGSRAARRLERELEILQRLDHPGIVRVFEGGLTACWRPYLVEEYVPGGTLKRALPLGTPGPCAGLRGLLDLFARICDAVDHAHKHGVVHRDLKPANVLLDENGAPKVADFGIARELAAVVGADDAAHTATRGFVGSLAYASPESTEAPGLADVRSDVFALGVMLYEMLTGVPVVPREASLRERVLALEHFEEHLPSRVHRERLRRGLLPPGAPRRFPRELDAVVAEALALDREERYQSAAALGADVRAVLDGRPLLARRVGPWRRTMRFARRHRTALVGLGVAVLGALALARQEVERSRERQVRYEWALGALGVLLDQAAAGFERLVGGEAYRGELLRSALSAYESMLEQHPGDPALRLGRARCRLLLGVFHRDQGETEQALASYRLALDDLRDLASGPGATPEAQRALSLTLVRIGDVHKESGLLDEAEHWYREALAVDERRVAADPDAVDALDDLFWSHHRLGHLHLLRDEVAVAREAFARLEPLATRIQELAPEREANWNLAFAVSRTWAAWNEAAGRGPALDRLGEAVAAARRRVAEAPELWYPRYQLASVLLELATMEGRLGRGEAALRHAREARDLLAALVEADPGMLGLAGLLLRTDLLLLGLEASQGGAEPGLDPDRVLARLGPGGLLPRLSPLDRIACLGAAEETALELADAGRAGLGAEMLATALETAGSVGRERNRARLRALVEELRARAEAAAPR